MYLKKLLSTILIVTITINLISSQKKPLLDISKIKNIKDINNYFFEHINDMPNPSVFQVRKCKLTWEMQKRYGLDENKNNLIELNNSQEYASATEFKVVFTNNILMSSKDFGLPTNKFFLPTKYSTEWFVNGSKYFNSIPCTDYNKIIILLKDEVLYKVKSKTTVEFNGHTVVYISDEIEVFPNDILIVALGDSFGSGEGNPDLIYPALKWADSQPLSLDHHIAHRSTTNWSSLAAYQIENADPYTSVTYINLASSGARIEHLVDKFYGRKVAGIYQPHNYIQIDEAKRLVGNRKIDGLLLSVGGNDAGFMQSLIAYMLRSPTEIETPFGNYIHSNLSFDKIRNCIKNGNWDNINLILGINLANIVGLSSYIDIPSYVNNAPGIDKLSDNYHILNNKIKSTLPNVKNVYILKYPDFALNCNTILNRENREISSDELSELRLNLLDIVNNKITIASNDYGWKIINPGIWSGHGYCASEAPNYQLPKFGGFFQLYSSNNKISLPSNLQNFRFSNTFQTSEANQNDIFGAGHPNGLGHYEIAKDFLIKFLPNSFQIPTSAIYGDFNKDGRTDILKIENGSFSVSICNGPNFDPYVKWYDYSYLPHPCGYAVGDFNGDGRDDIVGTFPNIGIKVYISTGNSFTLTNKVWNTAGFGEEGWRVGKFNADNYVDLMRHNAGKGVEILLSTGSSFQEPKVWSPAGFGYIGWKLGDVNGDNKTDLLRFYNGIEVLLSNGVSFENPKTWLETAGDIYVNNILNFYGFYCGDFDGDNDDDILFPGINFIPEYHLLFALETNGETFGPNANILYEEFTKSDPLTKFNENGYKIVRTNSNKDNKIDLLFHSLLTGYKYCYKSSGTTFIKEQTN